MMVSYGSIDFMFRKGSWSAMEKSRQIAKVYRKVSLYNQPTDFAYWQTQPYTVRLATVEEIRREYHGWQDDAQPRLQRVFTIVKR